MPCFRTSLAVVIAVWALLDFSGSCLGATETPKELVEGPIELDRDKSAHYGPSRAKLVRVWQDGDAKHQSYTDWLKAHYGEKPILYLSVAGTPYSLLIVGGKVTPLILAGTRALWRVDGFGNLYSFAVGLSVDGKRVKVVVPGGDMRQVWTLDFGQGLKLRYWEEYDGY
jgi:hypothetical protein